jgi:hypothetical protein
LPVLQDANYITLREPLRDREALKFDPASGILGEEKSRRVERGQSEQAEQPHYFAPHIVLLCGKILFAIEA